MNATESTAPHSLSTDSSRETTGPKHPGKEDGGIYRRIVMQSLEPMTKGCLQLELPDGMRRTIGSADAAITAEVKIIKPRFFKRCVLFGDIGFGESYVDGDWETPDIERVIAWFILNHEHSPSQSGSRAKKAAMNLLGGWNRVLHLLRPNSERTSRRNIAEHYDLGNDFYKLWLDPTMTYSSALFTEPGQSLESGQIAKYEALCSKLRLHHSDRVLEIGGGWGGFACHAAKRYGCRVTAVTISKEQHDYARARVRSEGLEDRVDILLQDYRKIGGRYDKIVSIEMMEALGDRYLETFFAKVDALLAPQGIAAFQYITVPDCRFDELKSGVDWIQKHIFPGSLLLSAGRLAEAAKRTGDLSLYTLDDMGLSYARTLRLWREAFNAKLREVSVLGFDSRFVRKWNYYLCYCEAAFAMRNISVVQAVYSRPNNLNLTTHEND